MSSGVCSYGGYGSAFTATGKLPLEVMAWKLAAQKQMGDREVADTLREIRSELNNNTKVMINVAEGQEKCRRHD